MCQHQCFPVYKTDRFPAKDSVNLVHKSCDSEVNNVISSASPQPLVLGGRRSSGSSLSNKRLRPIAVKAKMDIPAQLTGASSPMCCAQTANALCSIGPEISQLQQSDPPPKKKHHHFLGKDQHHLLCQQLPGVSKKESGPKPVWNFLQVLHQTFTAEQA